MLSKQKSWFTDALNKESFIAAKQQKSLWMRSYMWFSYRFQRVFPIVLWLIWLSVGAVVSYIYVEDWYSYESVYFAVSSLSTGGLWAIPENSTDIAYLFGIKCAM